MDGQNIKAGHRLFAQVIKYQLLLITI